MILSPAYMEAITPFIVLRRQTSLANGGDMRAYLPVPTQADVALKYCLFICDWKMPAGFVQGAGQMAADILTVK